MLMPAFPEPLAACAPVLGAALLAQQERSGSLVSIKDIESGRYVWVNAPMAELFGRPCQELIGRTDAELPTVSVWPAPRAAEQAALSQPGGLASEHHVGEGAARRHFRVLRMPLAAADESPPRLLCAIWSELTEGHRREAQLKAALEQLEQEQQANRVLRRDLQDASLGATAQARGVVQQDFADALRRELDLSSREQRDFALISVLIDPLVEPALTAAVAVRASITDALERQLRYNTRAMDTLCRTGGEGFAVLLSGVGLATAHSRMQQLRLQCATQIVAHEGQALGFTVSMGVASYPHTADSRDALLEAAQSALAEARRRGGNRVVLASIRFESPAAR